MSEVKTKVPQLRFPGFSDEWEEKKLGNISKLTSSKRVYLDDYVQSGIPFYRGKEISELQKGLTPKDILYISNESYEQYKSKYGIPQVDDILITAVGTLGNILRIKDRKPFYFKDGNLIWIKDIYEYSNFLEILLEVKNKEIQKTSIGSTQRALTMVELRKLLLPFPAKQEQQKIAAFLTAVDNKIEQLIKKQELLGEYKKGLMQQIFSRAIRFKADDGSDFPNWEEKKLGDVVSTPVSDGPHLTPKFVKQGVPFLSVNNLVESKIDFSNVRYISIDDHLVFSKKCKPKKGDVLLGKAASVGKVAFVETDVEFNIWSPIAMIRPGNSNFSKYIYYCFQTRFILNQISKFTNSSSQGNIGMGDINKIIIKLPNKLEQTKIANFLSSIDTKIEQVGKQLDESKQFKKALLQQMFV